MTSGAGDMDLGVEVSKGVVLKFLQAGLGFIGTIIFAQVLGPATFGGFYLLLSLVQIVDFPTDGIATAGKKRYSEAGFPKSEVVGFILVFNSISIGIATLLATAFGPMLVSFTGLENAPILTVLMLGSMMFFYPFQRLLVAGGRLSFSVFNDTVRSVLTLGFQLILVYKGWGASGMAFGWALSTLPIGLYSLYSLTSGVAAPTRETARSIWDFARYSIIQSAIGKAYSRYDVLLIGFLLTPALAGNYEVAFKLTIPGSYIGTIAGSGLMAKVSDMSTRGETVGQKVSETLAFVSVLSIPIFFGALALNQELVVIVYGEAYREAATLLVGLALFQVIHTQSKILRRTLSGLDLPDIEVEISALTLLLNISLGYFLALEIGALGVVIATVVGELFRYSVSAYRIRSHVSGLTFFPPAIQSQILSGAGMFIVVWCLQRTVPLETWLGLLSIVTAGAVVYFLLLVAISKIFRDTARSIAGRLVA